MSPRPDELKDRLLADSDLLRGIVVGGPNGPYKCSQQVAQLRSYAIASVQTGQDVSVEDIYPANEVEARLVHLGWPTLSALPARPWDILSPGTQAPPNSGTWVSRRMVVHKWTISIRREDLIAIDPFIEVVEAALKDGTSVDKIRELRRIFAAWGEMVPLVAVVGASLAATGMLAPNQNLTGNASTFRPPERGPDVMQIIDHGLDITGSFERRFESRVQGGYPEILSKSGFNTWLTNVTNLDNSPTWEVVKVHDAAPITDLLPKVLRQQVEELFSYTNLVSRSPSIGTQMPPSFDGASLGLRAIKQINIWHNTSGIQDVSIVYPDDAVSGPYGFGRNSQVFDSFVLAQGESVTSCFVWSTAGGIASLQFVKNTTQISAFYGAQVSPADPVILTAGGSALLGLSGNCNAQSILQLQAVWRTDVRANRFRSISTATIGVANTYLFNDYQYLINPNNTRISKIRFRNTLQVIAGLQITYSSKQGDIEAHQETPVRGTDAGPVDTWTLSEGENIVQVKGRSSGAAVYQLEFITNQGNIKKFGQEAGDVFNFNPPNKDMVLYYLLGKSAGYIQSLTFVWGAPPP